MKKLLLLLLSLVNIVVLHGQEKYIRAFDLGGSGLKTALFRYDAENQEMECVETAINFGICPYQLDVATWVRKCMREKRAKDLDDEIKAGYSFGISLSGLDKLKAHALPSCDLASLFQLPPDKIRGIDDGAAHLVASLHTKSLKLPQGPIWNFGLGTGIGIGLTNSEHKIRNNADIWKFFDKELWGPWSVKESRTGLEMWIAGSGTYGLDQIITDNCGIVDDSVFDEFAARWKGYIEDSLLDYSLNKSPDKQWGTPAAIVFTGGARDHYGDRIYKALQQLDIKVPVLLGPKQAGLLGAAWNTVTQPFGPTALIYAIAQQDQETALGLLSEGADVNQRDALGNTALLEAIHQGSQPLVEMLVKHGADVNAIDLMGRPSIFHAVMKDDLEIAAFLIQHGANLNHTDYWGFTPISFIRNNNVEMAILILTHKRVYYN